MAYQPPILPTGWRAFNSSGAVLPGAKLKFYEAGTAAPLAVYADATLSTSLGSTVTCDAGGYPQTSGGTKTLIFSGVSSYKVVLADSADVVVSTHDNVTGSFDTSAANSATLEDGVNNGVSVPYVLTHTTTGSPDTGIGTGLALDTETASGNTERGLILESYTTDVTPGTEDFGFRVKTMKAGAAASTVFDLPPTGPLQITGTAGYLLRRVLVKTASETYTPDAVVKAIRALLWGGGAGGGGVDGQAAAAGGASGGGAGGYTEKWITSVAASYTLTIGALGAGGTAGANNGSAGGNSSFTDGASLTLTANGGGIGTGVTASTSTQSVSGGVGGTASGGDINVTGAPGGAAISAVITNSRAISGHGGSASPVGSGGAPLGASSAGQAASGYGSGGSGACTVGADTANYAGGAGTAGLCIIEEYI